MYIKRHALRFRSTCRFRLSSKSIVSCHWYCNSQNSLILRMYAFRIGNPLLRAWCLLFPFLKDLIFGKSMQWCCHVSAPCCQLPFGGMIVPPSCPDSGHFSPATDCSYPLPCLFWLPMLISSSKTFVDFVRLFNTADRPTNTFISLWSSFKIWVLNKAHIMAYVWTDLLDRLCLNRSNRWLISEQINQIAYVWTDLLDRLCLSRSIRWLLSEQIYQITCLWIDLPDRLSLNRSIRWLMSEQIYQIARLWTDLPDRLSLNRSTRSLVSEQIYQIACVWTDLLDRLCLNRSFRSLMSEQIF